MRPVTKITIFGFRLAMVVLGLYWLAIFVGTHLPGALVVTPNVNDKVKHFSAFFVLGGLLCYVTNSPRWFRRFSFHWAGRHGLRCDRRIHAAVCPRTVSRCCRLCSRLARFVVRDRDLRAGKVSLSILDETPRGKVVPAGQSSEQDATMIRGNRDKQTVNRRRLDQAMSRFSFAVSVVKR